MQRREFIKVIAGSAASAWSLTAQAQQPPSPVIGFLRLTRAEESGQLVAAVRQGLRESGYPTDKAVIESRWGDGHEEWLPKLAVERVDLQVAAIVAGSLPAARAAKAATSSKSGHRLVRRTCLLLTQSGHRRPLPVGWCLPVRLSDLSLGGDDEAYGLVHPTVHFRG